MATRITLVRGDITRERVDAIVNAANERLNGGGGVDAAIHRAAGPQLLEACMELPVLGPGQVRCETGSAQVTPGFRLAAYVIHAVGPEYAKHSNPQQALSDCIAMSLQRAVAVGARTIAIPAVACGMFGFPIKEAAGISIDAVLAKDWNLEEVRFVLYSREAYSAWEWALSPS